MIAVGAKDLKNHLGQYLLSVRNGEEVLVTQRGKAVARLIPACSENQYEKDLASLAAEGLVELPNRTGPRRNLKPPIKAKGKPLSEIISEQRR